MAKATVRIILILSLASAVGLFALSSFWRDWQSAAQAQAPDDAGANEDDAQPDEVPCAFGCGTAVALPDLDRSMDVGERQTFTARAYDLNRNRSYRNSS